VSNRAEDKVRAESLLKSVHSLYLETIHRFTSQKDPELFEFIIQRQIIIPNVTKHFIDFGIGYTKYDTLSSVCDELPSEDVELLVELGLLFYRGDQLCDKFKNRLIFPVHDHNSKLIGFTGRLIKGNGPKWLDIQESFFYNKNNVVFNLDKAKESARSKNLFIMVEGAIDVYTLVRGGIDITIAPMGTYLTDRQAQLLRRIASRVILMMDPDQAGETATGKAKRLLHRNRFSVAIAKLPQFDPDRTVREQGISVVLKSLKEASDNGFD